MSQTRAEGECSWLHLLHSPDSLLASPGTCKGRRCLAGDTGLQERNMGRPQGEYFKPQGAVQGNTEMATGQGHPAKASKELSFEASE